MTILSLTKDLFPTWMFQEEYSNCVQERPFLDSMHEMPSKSIRSTLTKIGVSFFILLNLITLLCMNRPNDFAQWLFSKVNASFSTRHAAMLEEIPNYIYSFAHFAGLNVTWQMYSYLQRFDFTILAIGIDENGNAVLLPEPLQSQRTIFQDFVTDHREAKFQMNIFQYPTGLDFYASYLLRHYRDRNGHPFRSVRLDLQYRYFVDSPADALAGGQYFKGPESVVPMYPLPRTSP